MKIKNVKLIGLIITIFVISFVVKAMIDQELKDPAEGRTIAVGTVSRNIFGRLYFKGNAGWTNYPESYYLKGSDDFFDFDRGKIYEKWIFASVGYTTNEGGLSEDAYYMILPLKYFMAKSAVKDLASRKDFVGDINISWQFCEENSECVQLESKCGKKMGVNLKYLKTYLDFLKTKKSQNQCGENMLTKTGEIKTIKCVENFCGEPLEKETIFSSLKYWF